MSIIKLNISIKFKQVTIATSTKWSRENMKTMKSSSRDTMKDFDITEMTESDLKKLRLPTLKKIAKIHNIRTAAKTKSSFIQVLLGLFKFCLQKRAYICFNQILKIFSTTT